MEILDQVYQGAENKMMTSLMTLDQTAAFDSINHNLLIQKLCRYNIGPEARTWVENYLSHITQYDVLGRAQSRMKPLLRGFSQGLVIGHLLYAVYMNDMSEVTKRPNCPDIVHSDRRTLLSKNCRQCGTLTQYADDSMYVTGSRNRQDNQNNIRRSLHELTLYLNDNQLTLNLLKTSLTEIMIKQKRGRTRGQPPSLLVSGENGEDKLVEDSTFTRIFGGNIQNNMMWNSHLESGKKPSCHKSEKH